MLESPGGERVTTAALAQKLGVSEAALYRHFASKAQMFEGLIDFIESSLFGLIQQITDREPDPLRQVQRILAAVLQFAEQNPGMARVMVGDALVLEHERLTQRMNLIFDKLESAIKQRLREAQHQGLPVSGQVDTLWQSSVAVDWLRGHLQRLVRTGAGKSKQDQLNAALRWLVEPRHG